MTRKVVVAMLNFVAMAQTESLEVTKLLVEVCRHGAREPEVIYPFTLKPEDNFQVPFDLTRTGAEMHYALG